MLDPDLSRLLSDTLTQHGEVIIRTASGEEWEIHRGDDPHIESNHIRFVEQDGTVHRILYSHIERISYHRAHRVS